MLNSLKPVGTSAPLLVALPGYLLPYFEFLSEEIRNMEINPGGVDIQLMKHVEEW